MDKLTAAHAARAEKLLDQKVSVNGKLLSYRELAVEVLRNGGHIEEAYVPSVK